MREQVRRQRVTPTVRGWQAPESPTPGPAVLRQGAEAGPPRRSSPVGHQLGQYSLFAQRETSVSEPGDADERAADALAEQALRTPVTPAPESAAEGGSPAASTGARVRREAAAGATGAPPTGSAPLPAAGGSALPEQVRATFEPRFGHDFSRVRVHADAGAALAAEAMEARAFSVGQNIVFAAGQYAPHTDDGQQLLAHELAHVAQSRGEGGTIHRWHDDGHKLCALRAAQQVFAGGAADALLRSTGIDKDVFMLRLMDASCNMDRIEGHVQDRYLSTLPRFGASLVASGIRNVLYEQLYEATGVAVTTEEGRNRRGIKGEGPNHGEAGDYSIPKASAAPANQRHSEMFAMQAVAAYARGDYDTMVLRLGDAVHVSADRGSHEEGGITRGHDIRMPRLENGESGTNIDAGYMDKWDDNDNVGLNPTGVANGTQFTIDVLAFFVSNAVPIMASRQPAPPEGQPPAQGPSQPPG